MAKLGARNRTELLRMSKEQSEDNGNIDWSRQTIAIMSDGKALRKYDVRFTASLYSPARKHSYGWKVIGKVREGVDLAGIRAKYEALGYRVEAGNV